MKQWKNPTIAEYDIEALSKIIKAKAYSVGEAMEIGALYDQGNQAVGYSGGIALSPDQVIEAFVAAFNFITGIFTFIINGLTYFYNYWTKVLSPA